MADSTITNSRRGTAPALAGRPDTATTDPREAAPSRGRRVAFRVLAVLLALWLLAMTVFGLTEVVLMWLPEDVVRSVVGDDGEAMPSIAEHRSHFMAVGLVAWATVLSALAQLRRPERRVGSMRLLVVLALASLVAFGLSGTLGEWLLEEWTWVLPVLVLAVLHPRRADLLRAPSNDRGQLLLAGLAALPWAWYVLANLRLQWINGVGDEHAALEHWAIAALLGVVVVAGAAIGAGRTNGWRLPAGIAGVASILFGVHSLVFPAPASSLPAVAAVAATAWGVAYLVASVRRAREEVAQTTPPRAAVAMEAV